MTTSVSKYNTVTCQILCAEQCANLLLHFNVAVHIKVKWRLAPKSDTVDRNISLNYFETMILLQFLFVLTRVLHAREFDAFKNQDA